jgi:hypothetical protein
MRCQYCGRDVRGIAHVEHRTSFTQLAGARFTCLPCHEKIKKGELRK